MSPPPSYAQAAAALKIGQAIGGMISNKAISKGASQAAAAATNGAVGNALAAVVGVGSAAMLWSAVGGPIGVAAGLAVAAQSLYGLLSDGQVSSAPTYATAIAAGQTVYCNNANECYSSVLALASRSVELTNKTASEQNKIALDGCLANGCYSISPNCEWCGRGFIAPSSSYTSPVSCPAGNIISKYASSCSALGGTPVAGSSMPAAELSKPVNPALLAAYANKSWQQAAAAPGYSGAPYDASNPITDAEASAWVAANPSYAPTVGDLFQPIPLTSGGAVPIAAPTTTTTGDTTAPTDPATNPPFVMPCGIAGMPACNVALSDPITTAQSTSMPTAEASDRPDALPIIKGLLPSLPSLKLPTFLTGTTCHAIAANYTLGGKVQSYSWDFCKFVNFFKDVLSFLSYVFSCFLLYGLAVRPRASES